MPPGRGVLVQPVKTRASSVTLGCRVSWDGDCRRSSLQRAILVQQHVAHAEELHHLARVVLVGRVPAAGLALALFAMSR